MVSDLVVKVLRIIAFFQPFLCITLVITSALQGAGDTKFLMHCIIEAVENDDNKVLEKLNDAIDKFVR
jgi:membrane protein required for beta-lactamase induction